MCGIVGYIGQRNATEILIEGLRKLEYRGYDSAGIALLNTNGVHVFKEKGRIAALEELLDETANGTIGIGHTRWATHGEPSRLNAHPHQSASERFTLVHNGVIENYEQLKKAELSDVDFVSETDTEVVVKLIEKKVQGGKSVEEAFRSTLEQLHGSYAIAMLDADNSDVIYVGKNKSPLLVGLGEGFNVVASDAMAMLQVTNQFVELMDQEIVLVTRDFCRIKKLDGTVVERKPFTAELDASDIEKGTYPNYMLKEIDEQPAVVRRIISEYRDEDGVIKVEDSVRQAIKEADRLYIIAAGTSYHAGLVGKQLFEHIAGIPTEVHIASEFSYNMPLVSKKPLFIFISQSGETADSRAVLVHVKKLGFKTLTVTNVPGSTLSREADHTLLLYAGPEIAVASTKAYTAQIAVLAITAADAAVERGLEVKMDLTQELSIVANAMQTLVDEKEKIEALATNYLQTTRNAFYIGRAVDYYVCLEAALKLKEISYVQAEGFAGGELKHGTIALIEKDTPVIAIATQSHVNGAIRSNVKEVVARGAKALIVSMEGLESEDDQLVLPEVNDLLTPLVSVIPLQLLAYYTALHRGCDVDKPRNLAKSVTVE
ncbi:glutamine--fructose-6-phosphate transaminase (isomerizing) [Pullulanibacillus sp. KACC 23026]|uniref:glutamine--fructose-6-phosphate transaminase (isomerizing) n=1 Tax=Pullulanibacillus sp. KACC 23026 TaxID=3028315 RepID=UPI0023B0040F|nr:glutamine--fructose-6-phosphate transaminase (isomerizing) [Pullulanibacillus sp. KACC 23026]WEG12611.1 glutamine--fructose-6-phosphate transaminase (isomerizing) [Pullulanibacillus sp. KACC 23026]